MALAFERHWGMRVAVGSGRDAGSRVPMVGRGGLTAGNAVKEFQQKLNNVRREIPDADAVYGRVDRDLLAAATKLRWIQSPAIGLEQIALRLAPEQLMRHRQPGHCAWNR